MTKIICPRCMTVHDLQPGEACPHCEGDDRSVYDFSNSDEYLGLEVPRVLAERRGYGLEDLVGGLQCVIINTEPERQRGAVEELLRRTRLHVRETFEDDEFVTCVLATPGSADFLVRSRRGRESPFAEFNDFPKSRHVPNTRLETFVFGVSDIERYVSIQRERGVRFLTGDILDFGHYAFIQTIPSGYTGSSIGFIEWRGERGSYTPPGAAGTSWAFTKPDLPHLADIGILDHTATRVKAEDRDAAIIEFMELTNYRFDFSIYVRLFNSITNVARLSGADFAMVFTSGIVPFRGDEDAGPTEKFIFNYGARVHHMAFRTERIEETYRSMRDAGMEFLIELVGSPEEGLKQTFSAASEHTLLVNEYIHRYGDFDGFFTKSNVTLLTESTDKQ